MSVDYLRAASMVTYLIRFAIVNEERLEPVVQSDQSVVAVVIRALDDLALQDGMVVELQEALGKRATVEMLETGRVGRDGRHDAQGLDWQRGYCAR